jgi:hypothetical protein
VFPSPDILKVMLKKFAKSSFDLIFINQEMIEYSFDEFQTVIPLLVKYLNTKHGHVIVNSIAPFGDRGNVASETWKMLIYLKTFQNIDSSLGGFDNGLLVFRFRPNLYVVRNDTIEIEAIEAEQHAFRDVTPQDHFFQIVDRFIPVLDFYHMLKWLSGSGDTARYTSIPWNKYCTNESHADEIPGEIYSHPFILC